MIYQRSKAKSVLHKQDKIDKLVSETVNSMAVICGRTLGPGGRPVLIDRGDLAPLATKDGVTVVKALGVEDASANIVVDAAKEICINTAKEAGDGTTTAIVLANAIVKIGQDFLAKNPKYNPQRFISELHDANSNIINPYLQGVSNGIDSEADLRHVARISANGDESIANAAVSAVIAAGDDGTVLINEGDGRDIRVENAEGYIVTSGLKDHGQIGPAFINDQAGQQAVMDKGLVVLYDGSMNDLKVPGCIQNAVADEHGMTDGTPILVFAHKFADVVLDMFAKSTKQGLTIVPIKTPRSGVSNGASMFLHDMAAYTNGVVYDPGTVEDMDEDELGRFETAKVNMYESFITSDLDDEGVDGLNARIEELKAVENHAPSEFDKSFLRAAIAKLTGGVSTIVVGGTSDLEIREKKDRVEDAVEAVRSAIAEGIVPGGCWSHCQIIGEILKAQDAGTAPESWGVLAQALSHPFQLLMDNCGEDQPFCEAMLGKDATVFDANKHEWVNAFEAGIIEPKKVVRVSIENAISVAALLIGLGGIVVTPRDAGMEQQLELANSAFKNMMDGAGQQ